MNPIQKIAIPSGDIQMLYDEESKTLLIELPKDLKINLQIHGLTLSVDDLDVRLKNDLDIMTANGEVNMTTFNGDINLDSINSNIYLNSLRSKWIRDLPESIEEREKQQNQNQQNYDEHHVCSDCSKKKSPFAQLQDVVADLLSRVTSLEEREKNVINLETLHQRLKKE